MDLQTLIAGFIVLLAAAAMLHRIVTWMTSPTASGCGSCPNKGAKPLVNVLPLIELQAVPISKPGRGKGPHS